MQRPMPNPPVRHERDHAAIKARENRVREAALALCHELHYPDWMDAASAAKGGGWGGLLIFFQEVAMGRREISNVSNDTRR